ncbi:hypothetical protein ACQ4LF_23590, partial [Aeromonas salmonicida]
QALDRLPAPLRAHLLPLFQAWQLHGLAALTEDTLVLTLAGRFWNVNLQAGLFWLLVRNPLDLSLIYLLDSRPPPDLSI